jgi:hypothetical protein
MIFRREAYGLPSERGTFIESITMRPLKWAVIATHTMRDKLDSIEVDFTAAEQAIADKIEALSTKMDQIMERLEAYESEKADQAAQGTRQAKTAKSKPTRRKAAKKV